MSESLLDEHRPRVLRAATYIVDNLARPLLVAEVARVAAMSEFHFHRVFAAVMDETVGEFIVRQRMELAALRLAYRPDLSITTIALESGYSSSANFAKAFAGYFGVRPSDVRNPERSIEGRLSKLTQRYGKSFQPSDLCALPPLAPDHERTQRRRIVEQGMRFEEHAQIPLACLRSSAGYSFETLSETWQELIERARQLGLCGEEVDAFGIAHDSPQLTAPELCRYDACVPYDGQRTLPAPLFHSAIPAGRYAIFRYAGPVSAIEQRMRDIYSLWFPSSSVVPDPHFVSFDHYIHDEPQAGQVDMEIWFKVSPRKAG